MKKYALTLLAVSMTLMTTLNVFAQNDDYECEVMSVDGQAYVSNDSGRQLIKEGDILKVKDVIDVAEGSSVDLAFDGDWKNTAQIEENSKVTVDSIYPIEIKMEKGGVYAKLKSLPSESRFEVTTPTAIAAVRGTEYRTAIENGETQVYNFSDSDVYVFGMDKTGAVDETPTIIKNHEQTGIAALGNKPMAPFKMNDVALKKGQIIQERIAHKIQQMEAQGRTGKIQPIEKVKRAYQEGRRQDPVKPYHANTAPPGKQKELEQRLKLREKDRENHNGASENKEQPDKKVRRSELENAPRQQNETGELRKSNDNLKSFEGRQRADVDSRRKDMSFPGAQPPSRSDEKRGDFAEKQSSQNLRDSGPNQPRHPVVGDREQHAVRQERRQESRQERRDGQMQRPSPSQEHGGKQVRSGQESNGQNQKKGQARSGPAPKKK